MSSLWCPRRGLCILYALQCTSATYYRRHRRLSSHDASHLGIQETQKLVSPDPNSADDFGQAVAVYGNYTVVGAYGDNALRGAAYIYRTTDDGASWHLEQKVVPPDTPPVSSFGSAVAIHGDFFVVGAPTEGWDFGFGAGAAYIYRTTSDSSRPDLVQRLTAPDAAGNADFGNAVAIDANYLVVGTPGNGQPYLRTGSAYIYVKTDGGAIWELVQEIRASDAAVGDAFGYSVAVDGTCIVVGARQTSDADSQSGSAYIFSKSPGDETWVQVQKLVPVDATDILGFALIVAVQGDIIAVSTGDPGVNIYVRSDDGSWRQTQQILQRDPRTVPNFALSANTMVIGSEFDDGAAHESGLAYIYRSPNGGKSWNFLQQIGASDAAAYDRYGWAVAVEGHNIVIGKYGSNSADNPGSAYTYQVLNCANFNISDGDGSSLVYDIRNALRGDIVETGIAALGSGGSGEICLVDGCYTIEVMRITVTEDSVWWTFGALSGGVPYGPTLFHAMNGTIAETTSCAYQDSNSMNVSSLVNASNASNSSTGSSSANASSAANSSNAPGSADSSNASSSSKGSTSTKGINGALLGGFLAATAFMFIVLACAYRYRAIQNDMNRDDYCCPCAVGTVWKNTLRAKNYSLVTETGPEHQVQLTGLNKEFAVSNVLHSTAANQAMASSYDTTRRGALRQALLRAKSKIRGLGAVRSTSPGLKRVLCTLQTTLEHVEPLLQKADDILAAGERIVSVVEVLQLVGDNTTSLDTTTAETCMNELNGLLETFAHGIQRYCDEGWLRQKWMLLANGHTADLAAVDAKIVIKLDDLLRAHCIARDQHTGTLLARQTYVLEAAMKEQITRRVMETGKDSHDAANELAENEAAILAVANAAHIDKEELSRELHRLRVDGHVGSDTAHIDQEEMKSEENGALPSGAKQGPSFV